VLVKLSITDGTSIFAVVFVAWLAVNVATVVPFFCIVSLQSLGFAHSDTIGCSSNVQSSNAKKT
jgi:hypothetical protein